MAKVVMGSVIMGNVTEPWGDRRWVEGGVYNIYGYRKKDRRRGELQNERRGGGEKKTNV